MSLGQAMNSKNDKIERIFEAAAEIESAQQRTDFLDAACGDDLQLRAELEELLQHDRAANSFLDQPALAVSSQDCEAICEAPGTIIGPYKLMEQIGEGAFGLVFVAEQMQPIRRKVALKIIKPGMDTKEVMARFAVERQALALMDHPHICQVFDAGATESGRPYFVMELVKGVPITEYCDGQKMAIRDRLELFITVCHAVQHAHTKGVIHRDLKPTNILVSPHDGVPVVKVIDFGVAKAIGQKLSEQTVYTSFTQMIGTPLYMSPEQAELNALDVDTRSDIYSLGVLLYELLTGTTPLERERFSTATFDEIRRIIREEEPPTPSTRLSSLGPRLQQISSQRKTESAILATLLKGDLDWVVMKALEKDRARRYQTVNGLILDMERHFRDEPVVARPPSTVYRLQKLWRRNRLELTAAALVLSAMVIATCVSLWQAHRATLASRDAISAQAAEKAQRTSAEAAQELAEAQRTRADQERKIAQRHLYAANLNLMRPAWRENDIPSIKRLLDETADYRERGFEWYYWRRRMDLQLLTLRGYDNIVWAVAFSPNGQRVVTGSDTRLIVWDAKRGTQLHTLDGHRGVVKSVAFSPDGSRIVTGSWDQIVNVWDARDYELLFSLEGHTAPVHSVAFSRDGQRIVTGGEDRTAILWDAKSGQRQRTLTVHDDRIWSVAFSPDGRQVLTGSWDRTAIVWDAENGSLLHRLTGHTAGIRAVAFSPSGKWIATGSEDETVKLWDANSGQLFQTLDGHKHIVASVAFSPDSRLLVSGSHDRTAKVWNPESGVELGTLKGHGDRIESVTFSPNSERIATGSADGTARIWSANVFTDPLPLDGHRAPVNAIAFSPDGDRIVSGGWDHTARIWDASSGRQRRKLAGHSDRVTSVAVAPDGARIITGSWDHTAKVWDVATGDPLHTLKGHSGRIWAVDWSPNGRHVATGSDDGTIKVWQTDRVAEPFTLIGHDDRILTVAFAPDGKRVASGCADGTVKIWDLRSRQVVIDLVVDSDGVRCVKFTPDGQQILTGGNDRIVTVWDAASGDKLLQLEGHAFEMTSLAVSPSGRRVITGSGDGRVKVWDRTTGKELLSLSRQPQELAGRGAEIYSVAISPDGRQIAAASADHSVLLWKSASSAQVQLWRQEEQQFRKGLARQHAIQNQEYQRRRADRTSDPGAIQDWLVLAPIPTGKVNGGQRVDREYVPHESRLQPGAGDRVTIGEQQYLWRAVHLSDYRLNINQEVGYYTPWSVAYAVCYVHSERERAGLSLIVGSDDQAKIFLNGESFYRRTDPRPYIPDQDEVRAVHLRAGLNVVVFKVLNETGDWDGSLRFADGEGNPIQGIRVTLNPYDSEESAASDPAL